MSGAEVAAAAPWIVGGLQGVGGYLSSGAEGKLRGYSGATDPIDPETMLGNYLKNLSRTGAVATQRATRPTSLPSAYVQPLPIFKGAGAVESVSAGALDPGYTQPELLTRGGVDWGKGQELFGEHPEAHKTYQAARQPDVYSRLTSGGLSQMEDALGLLGVTRDKYNRLMFNANLGQDNLPKMQEALAASSERYVPPGSGGSWDPPNVSDSETGMS